MLSLEIAEVCEIVFEDVKIQVLNISIKGNSEKALNYINETGRCNIGDSLYVNTIGIRLELGTGGYHIVYCNISRGYKNEVIYERAEGHIIKLKYTPMQFRVKSIEECDEDKSLFDSPVNLNGRPVIYTMLHSMLPPTICAIKYKRPDIRLTCIYTYGGAMNAENSFILRELKSKGLIDYVITIGECHGGDFEAINIYTALIYSFTKLSSDIAIVCCGPGIAGTSTYYGFSTLDFILPLYAGKNLGCMPVLIPRISFKEERQRHKGLSMQTVALLNCLDFPVHVPFLKNENLNMIYKVLDENKISCKHKIEEVYESNALVSMKKCNIKSRVMGRSYDEDPYYFDCCSAAGIFALNNISI